MTNHEHTKELKATIDTAAQALLEQLAQGESQRLLAYLAFASRFHHYSACNHLLISLACPTASHVAGYRTWAAMGYQVARGAKAIWILAPRRYKRTDDLSDEATGLYFVAVPVFDASQLTADKPLPRFFSPLVDDHEALAARMATVVQTAGIAISERDDTGLAQGYSTGGAIVLREGLDSASRFLVLVHEYAHEVLHQGPGGKAAARAIKERQAEVVAFVVGRHFAIDSPFSSDYLQSWGTTPALLLAELGTVTKTASAIIAALERREDGQGEHAVAA